MDTETKTFTPPYNIPWATFLSTLERMAADPPNRVDRTYLDSQSGTVQTYLIAAYKAFGLITEEAKPTDAVNRFADPEQRKAMIGELVQAYYPSVLELANTNSTAGELSEAFAKAFPSLTGASRIKAIRFFLSAATYAEFKLPLMWKPPKAPRGSSAGSRKSTRNGKGGQAGTPPEETPPHPRSTPQSMDEAKMAYFDLLISNANQDTKLDSNILDRIERLVGLRHGSSDTETQDASDPEHAPPAGDSEPGDEAGGGSP